METKVCYRCKEEKSIESFSKDRNAKSGRANDCKTCQVEYRLQWRKDNPKKFREQRNAQVSRRRLKTKMNAIEYKGGCCEDCGIHASPLNRTIFEFHHVDPTKKEFNICRNLQKKWDDIQRELDKCVLLCSKCHKQRHKDYNRGLRDTL